MIAAHFSGTDSLQAMAAQHLGKATHMEAGEDIRILIAEDQQLVRRAFAAMLSLETGMKIVGQAADGAEAIQLARQWRPDVVLMDLQMPRIGGIGAMKRILDELPDTKIIVLTTFDTDELVIEAISAGAHAYLLKDASEADIVETIRAVCAGQSRLSPKVAGKVMAELRRQRPANMTQSDAGGPADEPLTDREEKVLALVAKGKSNREIADTVFLAEGTVKNYVSRIMEKLHVDSRTSLAIKALGRRKP